MIMIDFVPKIVLPELMFRKYDPEGSVEVSSCIGVSALTFDTTSLIATFPVGSNILIERGIFIGSLKLINHCCPVKIQKVLLEF